MLAEHGISLRDHSNGNHKTTCPQCSSTRRKKKDPCLSVTVEGGGAVWHCHHCGWSGGSGMTANGNAKQYRRPEYTAADPTEKLLSWFKSRCISAETVKRANISAVEVWMPGCDRGETERAIAFPLTRDGDVINVKYRTADKRFRQEKDAEPIFYGLDSIGDAREVVVTEGEIDALSVWECGLPAISVPTGAPEKPTPDDTTKFDYVLNSAEILEGKTIILAVDGDQNGLVLEEELARRFGKDRCRRVSYPDGCKDLNEVLCRYGEDEVRAAIENAEFYPLEGLHRPDAYTKDVLRLHQEGRRRGLSTGWPMFDELATVRPGDVWVVTGVPNSGKSEFVDALAMNMARRENWSFAVCSFENEPDEHIAKWLEKYTEQPFWDGPSRRLTEGQLLNAMPWINQHFSLIRNDTDEPQEIDWVLQKARAAVLRHGIRGLIVDPYNELEANRPDEPETKFISRMLGQVRRFAQVHGVCVFFVAHPKNMARDKDGNYPVPTGYDISGGANWFNKSDLGLTIHRKDSEGVVEAHVWKARRKEIGQKGVQKFKFNKVNGTYLDVDGKSIADRI